MFLFSADLTCRCSYSLSANEIEKKNVSTLHIAFLKLGFYAGIQIPLISNETTENT